MKILHLMRHGKSSWDQPGVNDIDRTLLPKGILNNVIVAEKLLDKYGKPEKIICSPANRALHTATIMAREFKVDPASISIIQSIYESDTSTVLDEIEKTPSHIDSLMVIGHNPTFTQIANLFLPEEIDNIPTSGITTLVFDIKDWRILDKSPVSCHLEFPKKDYF